MRRGKGQQTQKSGHKFQLSAKPAGEIPDHEYLQSGSLNSDPDSAIHYFCETEQVAA